jgi:hypothetical protein
VQLQYSVKREKGWRSFRAVLCTVCAFTLTSSFANAQNAKEPLIAHVRAYRLDHIPVEDAERILVDLEIARDTQQIADIKTTRPKSESDLNEKPVPTNIEWHELKNCLK